MNTFSQFCQFAQSLRAGIIPCWGDAALDGQKPKAPIKGIRLAQYLWRRPPTSEEQVTWENLGAQAYGLICGRISDNLLGLDFDQLDIYREAIYQFHFLRQTLLSQSPRGMHFYLRLPSSLSFLRKRPMRGGDFIFNGGYIIGPGSVIGGHEYKIIQEYVPYELSHDEALELLVWLGVLSKDEATAIGHQSIDLWEGELPDNSLPRDSTLTSNYGDGFLTEASVLRRYEENLPKGRNNALFTVACMLAYSGIEITDKRVVALISTHILAKAPMGHRHETLRQRAMEADATVRSAYKREYRQRPKASSNKRGLPNSIREALLNYRWVKMFGETREGTSTILPRILDALLLAGFKEEQRFSYSQAQTICQSARIGTASLAAALTGAYSVINGKHIWSSLDKPKRATKPLLGDSDNRKVDEYQMPSIRFLAKLLGVKIGQRDPIEFADLYSHRHYREKLHRGYIDRLSPLSGITEMSKRLALSRRTIFRYNQRMKIVAVSREAEVILSFKNINAPINGFTIFSDLRRNRMGQRISPGRWLEIDGKRYPAKKGIALQALKKGIPVVAVVRLTSQYFVPEKAFGELRVKRLSLITMQAKLPSLPQFLLMQEASDFVSSTHDHLAASELSFDLYVESQQAKVSDEPIEDNLLLIKGLGSTRRWILKRAGIVTFAKLASADPEQVANLLGMGKYVSATQVRFWQAQAKKLRDGEDVQVWSYADWKIYQFELGRLVQYDRISDPKLRGERKRAIIAIFVKFDWVKYGNMSLFPDWLRRGIIRRSKS